MNRLPLLILILCFLLITWAQIETIWASLVSFFCYVILTVGSLESPLTHWRTELLEFWVAAIVWMLTPVGFSLMLYRRFVKEKQFGIEGSRWSLRQRLGLIIIGVFAYVALTCPILVTLGPTAQGSLVETRLLPPLSEGVIIRAIPPVESDEATGSIQRAYATANARLLGQRISTRSSSTQEITEHPDLENGEQAAVSQTIYVLGTDDAGRDVMSRMIYGSRVSLGIGVLAALGAVLIGGAIGVAAGVSRGVIDSVLMRLTDLFLAVPGLFLVIGIMAFVGQSLTTLIVVLAVTGWMSVARLVRGEVLRLRDMEFILAARMLNQPWRRIVFRHLIPNMRPVLVTAFVLQFGGAVLAEAALSFLGLGIQPPTPSWGNMMGDATGYLGSAWWMGIFPGAMLATVIVSAHLVAEDGGPSLPHTPSASGTLSEA